eukprot:2900640-Amphidinium_carterae.1
MGKYREKRCKLIIMARPREDNAENRNGHIFVARHNHASGEVGVTKNCTPKFPQNTKIKERKSRKTPTHTDF